MLKELENAEQLDALAGKNLFERVVAGESQRVLNLMRYIVEEMKKRHETGRLASLFDPLVAADPTTDNGLTPMATAALRLAQMALDGQMLDDYAKEKLDLDRMEMLMGEDPERQSWGKRWRIHSHEIITPIAVAHDMVISHNSSG